MTKMTEAMKTEVFAFAKEVRVNKTKLMEMVERVVAMTEAPTVGRVKVRNEELVQKLRDALGDKKFTIKDVPQLTSDRHYLVRKLEAEGLLVKVGKVEKTGRGRKDFAWMFADAV